MSNALEVNDSDFELQIEQHKGLAVVDFWATWCAPCRMVGPVLDQLAIEYEGKAKVAKVDVDVNIKQSTKFNVRSIPAILFFKDGKLVDQMIGFMGKPALAERLKQQAAAQSTGVRRCTTRELPKSGDCFSGEHSHRQSGRHVTSRGRGSLLARACHCGGHAA